MDSPQPDQQYVPGGGDNTAPATLPSCSHSFAAGTQVLMAADTTEPIQDVHVGDLVENAQPGGGNEVHKVDQVHVTTTDTDFTKLTVSTPTGPKTITGTQNHPYYDQSIGAFVNAANLKPGDRLQSIDAGANVTVLSVEDYTGHMVTYDLTIDGLHTYYVVAGETPVLVHNTNPACGPYMDVAASGNGIIADLDSNGLMSLVIMSGSDTPRGSEMFNSALAHFGDGVKGVKAYWQDGGTLSDNLNSFNAAVRGGASLEDAARATFTGKMSTRAGFSSVEITELRGMPGDYTNVGVIFR
jgi:hypothetical protein